MMGGVKNAALSDNASLGLADTSRVAVKLSEAEQAELKVYRDEFEKESLQKSQLEMAERGVAIAEIEANKTMPPVKRQSAKR